MSVDQVDINLCDVLVLTAAAKVLKCPSIKLISTSATNKLKESFDAVPNVSVDQVDINLCDDP